jgi:hypothetical protein
MSALLISRSADLRRLRDEGYAIEVKQGYLLIHDVPYVNSSRTVRRGVLVSELTLAGDATTRPSTHVVMFAGDAPCDASGQVLGKILNASGRQQLAPEIAIDHTFSSKPSHGYADYYEKLTTYIQIISGPATVLDPTATAAQFSPIVDDDEDAVFRYVDTASSRANIAGLGVKLAVPRIAILGLGGTGAYVLDLIAKTPVGEIHLFDGDRLLQHNAFRAPGAAAIEDLVDRPFKVAYYAEIYSRMRRGIVEHPFFIDATTVVELRSMDVVFICIDKGSARKLVVDALEEYGVAFIDVGMGVEVVDDALGGIVRVTASSPGRRQHIHDSNRLPMADADGDDEYGSNIQIADLNALNAALAVIRWKKMCGFYSDLEREYFSAYTIDGNHLVNDDLPE